MAEARGRGIAISFAEEFRALPGRRRSHAADRGRGHPRDELHTIPAIIGLARRARRAVTADLAVVADFITVLVLWGLVGQLPLPLGVAGHEGSTLIVALNTACAC